MEMIPRPVPETAQLMDSVKTDTVATMISPAFPVHPPTAAAHSTGHTRTAIAEMTTSTDHMAATVHLSMMVATRTATAEMMTSTATAILRTVHLTTVSGSTIAAAEEEVRMTYAIIALSHISDFPGEVMKIHSATTAVSAQPGEASGGKQETEFRNTISEEMVFFIGK